MAYIRLRRVSELQSRAESEAKNKEDASSLFPPCPASRACSLLFGSFDGWKTSPGSFFALWYREVTASADVFSVVLSGSKRDENQQSRPRCTKLRHRKTLPELTEAGIKTTVLFFCRA